jgi:putative hemolysin
MDILITVLIMIICLCAEAFFSGSEIGVVSADRAVLRHKAAQGSKGAAIALAMLEKPEWLLSTTLVGTNISVVTNTTMATALTIQLFGEQYSWVAIVTVAPMIWVFGEIVPKSIFQQHANTVTPHIIFPLRLASYLFYPILIVFSFGTKILVHLVGGKSDQNPFTLREEISTMVDMASAEGDILPGEQAMIRRIFNFSETTVGDIMVPLIDVAAIERTSTCAQARKLAVETAHKRQPVYDQRIDRVVGYLNTLELLGEPDDAPLTPFIQPVLYVPSSLSIDTLLKDLRRSGGSIAIVVDEFGGSEGLTTLEDIIEEVVGELEDEFDTSGSSEPLARKVGERSYIVNGRMEILSLREDIGIDLPDGQYETIAGFLMERTNTIPNTGTVILFDPYKLTIEHATEQVIREVRISW